MQPGALAHFDLEEAINMAYQCQYHNPIHNEHPPEKVDMNYIKLVASQMVESRDSKALPINLPEAPPPHQFTGEQRIKYMDDLTAAWDQMQSARLYQDFEHTHGDSSTPKHSAPRTCSGTDSGMMRSLSSDQSSGLFTHAHANSSIVAAGGETAAWLNQQRSDLDSIFRICGMEEAKQTRMGTKHAENLRGDFRTGKPHEKQPWNQLEISFLDECKRVHPRWNYERIAQEMTQQLGTSRTAKQVQQRWCRVQNPALNKGIWTPQEDELLRQLYQRENGSIRLIVKHIKTRTATQVHQRLSVLGIIAEEPMLL